MEVVVATDSSVISIIGRNKIKAYIMTIMNIVSHMWTAQDFRKKCHVIKLNDES